MDPVTALSQLPYREVWTIDTEFIADRGAKPIPVCLVALELRSGNTIRQWASECGPRPPIPTGPDALAVAWFATAEWSYFLAAGWPLPAETIDLFAEYRSLTNGRASNHPGLGQGP